MHRTCSGVTLMLVVIGLTAVVPAWLPAQSIWLDRRHDKTFGLEILVPNFQSIDSEIFRSSNSGAALFASLRLPLSESVIFVGEIPFAYGRIEVNSSRFNISESESESAIGNPYLGLEHKQRNSPVFAEFGIHLPLASEKKGLSLLTGLLTDVDRLEAFAPGILAVTGVVNVHQVNQNGFAFRLRGGPSLLINTDKDQFEEGTDWFIGYSAQAGYESESFSMLGGLTGRANVGEGSSNFSERSVHQLGINASVGMDKVRPGVHLRLPLDKDLRNDLDFVLGLNLGIQL